MLRSIGARTTCERLRCSRGNSASSFPSCIDANPSRSQSVSGSRAVSSEGRAARERDLGTRPIHRVQPSRYRAMHVADAPAAVDVTATPPFRRCVARALPTRPDMRRRMPSPPLTCAVPQPSTHGPRGRASRDRVAPRLHAPTVPLRQEGACPARACSASRCHVRDSLTQQRAAAYGYGWLTLSIGAKPGATVQILNSP